VSLPSGTRIGPYEIVGPLGAGGMGEVYRARDTRLGREVAIKILPAAVAQDRDALSRFEREARAVAALSHPNILAIHDFGVDQGRAYSVTELLEGRTLRDRLAEGPLPLRKAIECAAQIARGLAAAHDKGVVHRDLKPENLFVTEDGRVKILDFGLAKVAAPGEMGGAQDPSSLTQSPTIHLETRPGMVLGTIGYMAPEQVRGIAVDHRSDLFAFGAVLYEMLTGTRAFKGATAADTMTAILREDPPPMSATNRAVPEALERLVHHCLEKNPAERFQSARDLAFHLEAASGVSGASGASIAAEAPLPAAARRTVSAGRAALLGTGLAAVAVGIAAGVLLDRGLHRPQPAAPPSLRQLTYTGADSDPAASPDGRLIAYTSAREGGQRIWLKQYPGGDEVALTSGPDRLPRFSPDGMQVLFIREGTTPDLYRVPVVGGEPRRILENVSVADWSPDGRQIAFVRRILEQDHTAHIVGVVGPSGEGMREIGRNENTLLVAPRYSPDGGTIALIDRGAENAPNSILLLKADGSGRKTLQPPPPAGTMTPVVWSGDGGSIAYAQEEAFLSAGVLGGSGRLIRQEVDSGRAETLMWVPARPLDLAILGPGKLILASSTQRQNLLATALGAGRGPQGPRWITRGNAIDRQPVFSPDGEWVMFSSNRSGNLEVWKASITTGAIRRLTDDPAQDWDPAFTPDGKGMLWSSSRTGHFEIWIGDADGTGARQLTNDGVDAENPTMTPDGKWVVYNSSSPAHSGIWKIRADGGGAVNIVPGAWSTPEVSPDGAWVAFRTQGLPRIVHLARVSDGRLEAMTIPMGMQNTGGRPRWIPDGRALLFNGYNAAGEAGVFVQEFVPGVDTSARRRPFAGFDHGQEVDSFAISRDGVHFVQALSDTLDSLLLAEGVPGIEPPQGRKR
jgi:Tol biopolymer transport system component